jgi:hypothetical protein
VSMSLFFEIDVYSHYGPQVFYLKVDLAESLAHCKDFMGELTHLAYESAEQLIKLLFDTWPEAFMLDEESEWKIEASPEIEALARQTLWDRETAECHGLTPQQAVEARLYL